VKCVNVVVHRHLELKENDLSIIAVIKGKIKLMPLQPYPKSFDSSIWNLNIHCLHTAVVFKKLCRTIFTQHCLFLCIL
jgi:hypothetical protein